MPIIRGTDGNDNPLNGTDQGDAINGFGGNDHLFGLGGNDNMHGDAGNDILEGGDGNDVLDGGLDGNPFDDSFVQDTDTLDGGAGIDTVSYSNVQHAISISLLQGIVLGQGNVDTLISIENATGTNFNDSLIGDAGANLLQGAGGNDFLDGGAGNDNLRGDSGNDTLKGNVGNDLLVGGGGADKLDGGSGADTFQYFQTADSGVGSFNRDVIADFVHQSDKMDLHAIDAKAGASGNQDFTFIGSSAFSAEGQVRAVSEGDHVLVQMNTTGNDGIDAEIQLTGHPVITGLDFIL
jgi:Ca2+-binding RTX toxin-like protein